MAELGENMTCVGFEEGTGNLLVDGGLVWAGDPNYQDGAVWTGEPDYIGNIVQCEYCGVFGLRGFTCPQCGAPINLRDKLNG